jgi:hypothetical protein
MIRRFTAIAVLGTAAAATFIVASSAGGQPALTSMTTPLAASSYSAPPPAQKCPANFTSGVIGGQSKCLAQGQQCQQPNTGDYTHYGFDCVKAGNRYQLRSRTKPAPARPAVAKPAPAKPAPARPAVAKPAPAKPAPAKAHN